VSSLALPSRIAVATLAALTAFLSACGGGGGSGGGGGGGGTASCSEPVRKDWVLAVTREWYLFPETLPATVNTADYSTAESLLDALTANARAQGKDRHFSYLTTRTAENSLLGDGQFNGFGFRTRTDPVNRPMIVDVFAPSPASDAGLQRGDEIVAVDQGSGFVPVSQSLANGGTITDLLGPSDVGVVRGLRLLRNGAAVEVSVTKRTVTIDPVPDGWGVQTNLVLPGTTIPVGYVHLRTYITTADQQLRDAFARFRAANLQYYIVDLRYNGGGLISIAQILNDLLGGARSTSEVQFRTQFSANKSGNDTTYRFQPRAQSVQPVRIAFLTTDGTASASEININSMKPYVEAAIVGDNTYGKPVGQQAFDLGGCDDRLRLISFRMVNSLGQSDYYHGLASSMQFACAATDTLDRPLGDAAEGLTSAALSWLKTGACGQLITASGSGSAKPGGGELHRFPLSKHPSAAEFWLPGVN